jgi:hypothetical protein
MRSRLPPELPLPFAHLILRLGLLRADSMASDVFLFAPLVSAGLINFCRTCETLGLVHGACQTPAPRINELARAV